MTTNLRRIAPLAVVIVVSLLSWPVITALLRIFGLMRAERGGIFDLLIEVAAAYGAVSAGFAAARRFAAPVNTKWVSQAVRVGVFVLTIVAAALMWSVSGRADWSVFDWLATFAAPAGALLATAEISSAAAG